MMIIAFIPLNTLIEGLLAQICVEWIQVLSIMLTFVAFLIW